jgi:hypothetical protein
LGGSVAGASTNAKAVAVNGTIVVVGAPESKGGIIRFRRDRRPRPPSSAIVGTIVTGWRKAALGSYDWVDDIDWTKPAAEVTQPCGFGGV